MIYSSAHEPRARRNSVTYATLLIYHTHREIIAPPSRQSIALARPLKRRPAKAVRGPYGDGLAHSPPYPSRAAYISGSEKKRA